MGAEQGALIESLRGQIKLLQNEADKARENLEALRVAHANDSSIAAAAEIDGQALAKAKEDLEAIEVEKATLKAAHDEALNSTIAKISTLELQASTLAAEKDEASIKLTELEVKILESKDAVELAEGEVRNSKAQIDALRAEVAKAVDVAEEAARGATAKESAAAEHLEEVQKQHADALALADEESKRLAEELGVLQAEADELRNNLEAANATTAAAAEEHARRLKEVEEAYQGQQEKLTAEMGKISAELNVRG
jgi:chromosome segregation ATPase